MSTIVAGIDVGSLTTKVLLMDAEDKGRIVSFRIGRSGSAYRNAVESIVAETLDSAGLRLEDIRHTVSTGYGREIVSFSNSRVTEITCHGRGAKYFFPEVHTVIDIGGQDSKVISINDLGGVANFTMNDKCAAGTGRFLEVMASALEVEIGRLGELSAQSGQQVKVSSMCTVFAESEVISLLSKECSKSDIAAAIHEAIARRITGMVGQVGLRERVVMVGGVAKNIGVVRSLEKMLGTSFLIPPEPQINGALGAALIAAERLSQD
ncbi:MAG TPA: acyl-CoA dehydratase activase [Thermodesulfobacteriota bacterium]|nr:acyl-CoA dehydratase activase [Thermodesulfobacteriota bacterium]